MKKPNKESKIKNFYHKFKEAWQVPGKRAGIKLLGYVIFFLILFLLAGITSNMNKYNDKPNESNTTTTSIIKDNKYNDKLSNLLLDKYNINYVIKNGDVEYKINGIIENNIVTGYLELNDEIKKIVFKDNLIYEVKNNEEVLVNLETDLYLVNLDNLISLIRKNSPFKEVIDGNNKYTYNFKYNNEDVIVVVLFDEDSIIQVDTKINILEYKLIFDN